LRKKYPRKWSGVTIVNDQSSCSSTCTSVWWIVSAVYALFADSFRRVTDGTRSSASSILAAHATEQSRRDEARHGAQRQRVR
jgi:hypothetical protein